MSPVCSHRWRAAGLLGSVAAAALGLVPAAQAASGTQFDSFRLAGGTRYTVVVAAAAQVPGLPAWAPGYHRYCGTTTGPVIRHRIKYSTSGDVSSWGLAARYAKVGSTAYAAFGYPGAHYRDVVTYGAPRTADFRLDFGLFLNKRSYTPASPTDDRPIAPRPGLYDVQLIPQVQYIVELYPGLPIYTFPQNGPTLAAKLDFRVVAATAAECTSQPYYVYGLYLRAPA